MNVNNYENSVENCKQMYRLSRFVENFECNEFTKLWIFNGKLCILDVPIVWDLLKKLNSSNVQNRENSMENYVH